MPYVLHTAHICKHSFTYVFNRSNRLVHHLQVLYVHSFPEVRTETHAYGAGVSPSGFPAARVSAVNDNFREGGHDHGCCAEPRGIGGRACAPRVGEEPVADDSYAGV